MRLLNVNTMRLEEYFGSRIPDYSILSHCWGADEIGFQDINRPNWRSMRGAAKIESACTVSRRQNETYIWIDTCCIDKSSSAELSEAINSMYNWYQRATQCFAYLEDVSGTLFLDDPTEIDENAMDEIQRSRWFRRGWTLQELIAPRSVLFLNKEWNPLGERSSLSRLLSSITTVPEDILSEPEDITSCSIARKMSWAASRETSREEDMAYCLLGIFGVNMPLLYGEGMGAFIRLQEEILKESDDQSIFAWSLTDPLLPPLLPGRVIIPGNNKEGVLANHPAHFAGSANIVPFPSEPERQPFSMTNRGLRIELRVLNYRNIRREQLVGILDCHYKDDFSSAIGIYLDETANKSIFTRYGFSGLAKCPAKHAKTAKIRTIYIKKLRATTDQSLFTKCLIRWETVKAQGYQILDISGYTSWNMDTNVFELYTPSTYSSDIVHSIVSFQIRATGHCFAIVLDLWDEKEPSLAEYPRRSVNIVPKPESTALDEWLRDVEISLILTGEASGQIAYTQKSRDHHLLPLSYDFDGHSFTCTVSAKATEEELLNQKITVLEVEFV